MFLNIRNNGNIHVINVKSKSFGLSEGITIRKKILELQIKNKGYVVIDFNNCKKFNNMFIQKLLSAGNFCANNDIDISFCGISPDSLYIFYLLKLDNYFEIYATQKDAISRKNRLIKRIFQVV